MLKVIEGGFEPVRGTKYSAYVDLFSAEDVTIGAGETKVIKLGVKLDMEKLSHNYFSKYSNQKIELLKGMHSAEFQRFLKSHYLEVALRSSLGVKGLIIANGIGIIDLDYPDEIGLIVHNPYTNKKDSRNIENEYGEVTGVRYVEPKGFYIKKGDKVAQCTLKEHKSYLLGYETETIRTGGYGSTGN